MNTYLIIYIIGFIVIYLLCKYLQYIAKDIASWYLVLLSFLCAVGWPIGIFVIVPEIIQEKKIKIPPPPKWL